MAEACRELGLRPREFQLALQLGEVATVAPAARPGPCRVPVAELARLRAERGGPDPLRQRLRLVGAREGAVLLGIPPARFARLARAGCVAPVRFTLNRYRAVVWLYRAAEVRDVAGRHPELLAGVLPEGLRRLLDEGEDWRPRHWRNRRVAQLLRRADDPWAAAAAHAAVLAPDVLEEAVPDVGERTRLTELRPDLVPGRLGSPASRKVVEGLLTADGEEEIRWHRLGLSLSLDAARSARRPYGTPAAEPCSAPSPVPPSVPPAVPPLGP